jgi:hypothetical protein
MPPLDPAVLEAAKKELADTQTSVSAAALLGKGGDVTDIATKIATDDGALSQLLSEYVVKENDELVLRFPDVVKDDGTVLKSDTIYKGKTEKDLIAALVKGVTEKDSTIKRLSEERPKRSPLRSVAVKEPQSVDDAPATSPDIESIRTEVAQELLRKTGLDSKFLQFKDEDWDAFERDNTAWRTNEARAKVREFVTSFQSEVSSRYNKAVAESTTSAILANEADQIESLLSEYNVSISDADFEALIQEALDDKKNFDSRGALKSGVVTAKFLRKVKGQLTVSQRTDVIKKIDDAVDKATAVAAVNVGTKTTTGGAAVESTTTGKLTNLQSAKRAILADIASGRLAVPKSS